jgi:predicted nucleic acid-binding protein
MIVVADTSPLNYLVRLQKVEILPQLYGHIVVPTGVLAELRHAGAPSIVRMWAATPPPWLEVVQVHNVDSTLAMGLGAGEREAISVALELNAELLLIDDRLGRSAAEVRWLPIAGTLAILLRAGLHGLVDFPTVLQQVQQFRFSCIAQGRSLHACSLPRATKTIDRHFTLNPKKSRKDSPFPGSFRSAFCNL